MLMAESSDFVGVSGDKDLVELRASEGSLVNPCKHWATGDDAEDLARETRGGEAGGYDSEHALFVVRGIKYDGIWLCRGDSPSDRVVSMGTVTHHIGGVAQMVRATDS